MKKIIILGLSAAVVLLSPLMVSAAADSKYPAANFEPNVIYIDKDAVSKDQAQNEYDPKYPASNFTPIVIFTDEQLAHQTQADEFDPKYPAAYFKPKVIYP
jgi:disulfide oxidoreductase YuzD